MVLLQILQSKVEAKKDFIGAGAAVDKDDLVRFSAVLRDLDPILEAVGLTHFINKFGWSQEP